MNPPPEPPPQPNAPTPAELERFQDDMLKMPKDAGKRWQWWREMREKYPWLLRCLLGTAALAGLGVAAGTARTEPVAVMTDTCSGFVP